jgi:hypothetical protein
MTKTTMLTWAGLGSGLVASAVLLGLSWRAVFPPSVREREFYMSCRNWGGCVPVWQHVVWMAFLGGVFTGLLSLVIRRALVEARPHTAKVPLVPVFTPLPEEAAGSFYDTEAQITRENEGRCDDS